MEGMTTLISSWAEFAFHSMKRAFSSSLAFRCLCLGRTPQCHLSLFFFFFSPPQPRTPKQPTFLFHFHSSKLSLQSLSTLPLFGWLQRIWCHGAASQLEVCIRLESCSKKDLYTCFFHLTAYEISSRVSFVLVLDWQDFSTPIPFSRIVCIQLIFLR